MSDRVQRRGATARRGLVLFGLTLTGPLLFAGCAVAITLISDDRGTGLRGIRRRLGTFDGTLDVSSPAGGPTRATMGIPCALSSPKTSSSSGTA